MKTSIFDMTFTSHPASIFDMTFTLPPMVEMTVMVTGVTVSWWAWLSSVGACGGEMPPFFGHLAVRFSSFHVIQNTPFPA